MNRPPFKTMLLGHPLVCLPAYGLGGFMLYGWATQQTSGAGVAAVVTLGCLGPVITANERRAAFLKWKRAWDGMAADAPQRRANRRAHRFGLAIGAAIVLLALLAIGNPDAPIVRALPGLFFLAAVLGFGWLLVRRIMRQLRQGRTRRRRDFTVTVRARRLMPVPTLQQAYAALPPHCRPLLQPTQAVNARR